MGGTAKNKYTIKIKIAQQIISSVKKVQILNIIVSINLL